MIRIAICDDDREYAVWLENQVRTVFQTGTEISIYSSGEDYLVDADLMHELIFLDVEMPGIDGIETAAKIRLENRNAVLIFISGVRNPTTESFKVAPYRYLLKSFTDETLSQELSEIAQEVNRMFADDYLIGERDGRTVQINLRDILYISIVRGGCEVHLFGTQKSCIVREKLVVLAQKLKTKDFAYAHNSYLVNLRNVDSFSKTEVTLKDHTVLTISRSKYGEFEDHVFEYWGRKYV